jgi:predicted 2-oxoglutarate/Fe(II)-dependent dioxygenase YbiX/peroxiredoxin
MAEYASVLPGDPAPLFYPRSSINPRYAFHTAAGRYVVLCFFGSAADAHSQAAIAAVQSRRGFFDDVTACFFGISNDPQDEAEKRVADDYPGYEFFWDFDFAAARLYGVAAKDISPADPSHTWRRFWFVLDPMLRVMRAIPFQSDRSDLTALLAYLDALPPPSLFAGFELPVPILVLPDVFEPDFCRKLISLYEANGGQQTGVFRDVDGQNVGLEDDNFKRRRDYYIEDRATIRETQLRVARRIAPEIARLHFFKASHMERYIIGCYSADESGHFEAHRDNTMLISAHRRFAVTINLNDDYDGGELSFPEYSPRKFKSPIGCAVVFSCSMLHAVATVTRGRRYAFLPFLFDEAAAKILEQNRRNAARAGGATPSNSGY